MKKSKIFFGCLVLAVNISVVLLAKDWQKTSSVYYLSFLSTCRLLTSTNFDFEAYGITQAEITDNYGNSVPLFSDNTCTQPVYFHVP